MIIGPGTFAAYDRAKRLMWGFVMLTIGAFSYIAWMLVR